MNSPTTHNIIEDDIRELFGFEELTDEEKAEFLDTLGSTIIESATLRFIVESEDTQAKEFTEMIETQSESEDFLRALITSFPRFGEILEEEVSSFKAEAIAVLEK